MDVLYIIKAYDDNCLCVQDDINDHRKDDLEDLDDMVLNVQGITIHLIVQDSSTVYLVIYNNHQIGFRNFVVEKHDDLANIMDLINVIIQNRYLDQRSKDKGGTLLNITRILVDLLQSKKKSTVVKVPNKIKRKV